MGSSGVQSFITYGWGDEDQDEEEEKTRTEVSSLFVIFANQFQHDKT